MPKSGALTTTVKYNEIIYYYAYNNYSIMYEVMESSTYWYVDTSKPKITVWSNALAHGNVHTVDLTVNYSG
jgi:hypothetical protein